MSLTNEPFQVYDRLVSAVERVGNQSARPKYIIAKTQSKQTPFDQCSLHSCIVTSDAKHAHVKERGCKYRLDSVDDKFSKSSWSVWIHLLTKHELVG